MPPQVEGDVGAVVGIDEGFGDRDGKEGRVGRGRLAGGEVLHQADWGACEVGGFIAAVTVRRRGGGGGGG